METRDSTLESSLRQALARQGVATAAQLQAAIDRSQPTVSRLLAGLGPELLVLGQGRSTRYALAEPFSGMPPRLPVHWVHLDGRIEVWGSVAVATGQRVHLEAPGIDLLTQGQLPWLLAPLRAEGFLGRLLAQRLALQGLDLQPERWSVAQQLFAASVQPDAPGALVVGEPRTSALPTWRTAADLDALAADVAATLPAGSSAGGEQAKFLARRADGQAVLVKFSPPRGTPFGERWHDLLHAEALALQVLQTHGVPVAQSTVIETPARTYLVSERFDRLPPQGGQRFEGRRHAVPLHAVHDAFVSGPRQHWAATAQALARQRRLPVEAAAQVEALLRFGHLIGNSDMHFGNLSLWVEPGDVAAGRFTLSPVYDMLPMRWRPDAQAGTLDLCPFTPEPVDLQSPARPVAQTFWDQAAVHARLSPGFRELARQMLGKLEGRPAFHALGEARRKERLRRDFVVDGERVGSVDEAHLSALQPWARWMEVRLQAVVLTAPPQARDSLFEEMNRRLRDQGLIRGWRDEPFPLLSPTTGQSLAVFERASARFWGTLTLGAHCNGWVAGEAGQPQWLWIARRSPTKATDPGKLDNLIGGGVPVGQTPMQTLIREGFEEAGLDPQQMSQARPVAVIELHRDVPEGLLFERLHAFDLQLPDGLVPRNQDGEVSAIERMALPDALAVASGQDMTVDAALVTLEFVLRHGAVTDAPTRAALSHGLELLTPVGQR